MKILCTICVRSSSKGLPNKNIKELLGKPLLAHSIDQAIESKLFQAIVVSTDSQRILDIANKYGAEAWFLRPKELSGDTISKIPVIQHALKLSEERYKEHFDVVIDLDATSPLRSVNDIQLSFEYFLKEEFDNLITGCSARRNPYFNMIELKEGKALLSKESLTKPTTRQSSPKVFDMNASIYIWKRKALMNSKELFNKNTGFYEMPEERSYDIDTLLDWQIVKMIMEKNLNKDESY